MTAFAVLPERERVDRIAEAADRLNVSPVIAEKDFWVCWILERIFSTPELVPHVVFKGGTSLSKVFGAIRRFSEDVDLSISPALLGWDESDLDDAPSKTMRVKRFARLETACADHVQGDLRRALEGHVREVLGAPPNAGGWLTSAFDETHRSPVLVFEYPSTLPPEAGYITPSVKMEFGSLTDQRPIGTHCIRPLLAEVLPGDFDDWRANVVALEIERTFWEKATILHAEHHRPAGQSIRDRLARHYSDFASLWQHPAREHALDRLDLLERVAVFKGRFFASPWASYASATPPTLRLCPPRHREPALARDYAKMEGMFLGQPPRYADMLRVLREAEETINAR